jgi:hypothetical protein
MGPQRVPVDIKPISQRQVRNRRSKAQSEKTSEIPNIIIIMPLQPFDGRGRFFSFFYPVRS